MAGRASIVGAAETSVGKVRDHNEDSHFIDPESGIFIVCDGMGGHAAGEVASNLAVKTIRRQWLADATQAVADRWLAQGSADARKQLLATVQSGVIAAHDAIVKEAEADRTKKGMGTTVVAAIVVGGDVVFAHCGDSRAYLVRDGITVQLTEDHTLLARLLAAGVDVDVEGDGARFKSMLTNALGIGHECKVSTFVVPVADGDRFLLCSDGITEYVEENEIGEVLTTMPSPARSAQRLVELALQRGGGDNATALVVRVLEAGETARPSEMLRREEQAINACPLWAKLNTQQRLRAQRICLPRDHAPNERIPAQTLGDRVAWILVEGEVEADGHLRGPGSLLYPEALIGDRPLPDKNGLAITQSDVRALALRADDFKELCEDDPELGEHLLEAIATEISRRRPQRRTGKVVVQFDADSRGVTDPGETARADIAPADAAAAGEAPAAPPVAIAPAPASPLPPAPIDGGWEGDEPSAVAEAAAEAAPEAAPASPAAMPPTTPAAVRATDDDEDIIKISTDELMPLDAEGRPRQPRASTVPPSSVRARSNTDIGAPAPDRAPAQPSNPSISLPPEEPPARQGARLISSPADTAAAVEDALSELTKEAIEQPAATPTTIPLEAADDDAEISVEVPAEPPPPVAAKPAPSAFAAPALRPPAKKAPKLDQDAPIPVPTRAVDPSEPEIQIEKLEEDAAAADASASATTSDEGEAIELSIDEDSARVVEILKDTSSQTIMLTVDDDEDDVVVPKTKSS